MISLSYISLAIFIYHEQWTLQVTPPDCILRPSLHFAFTERYIYFGLILLKIDLPCENDADSPV